MGYESQDTYLYSGNKKGSYTVVNHRYNDVNLAIIGQILSSFTFLDQKETNTNWKMYTSEKLGLSVKYPENFYLNEIGTSTFFSEVPFPTGEGPTLPDNILISLQSESVAFTPLFNADQGEDVIQAHNAVDVKVEKIRNLKISNHDAVEYVRNGLISPTTGLGRGPIGYEHHYLIKKNEKEFIDVVNDSMQEEKAKQRDTIFSEMVSSLTLK